MMETDEPMSLPFGQKGKEDASDSAFSHFSSPPSSM